MQIENKPLPWRITLYISNSALAAALSIGLICAIIAWSGPAMNSTANNMPQVSGTENAIDQARQQASRDVSGAGLLFFALLWFGSPALASALAIISSNVILDIHSRLWKMFSQSIAVVLVLVAVWLLYPWFYLKAKGFIDMGEVLVFRIVYVSLNLIIALVLIRLSFRESVN